DHPLEYGGFEGIIPEGQYGGGTVMLWDHGTWEPEGDPEEGYRAGKLHFQLHGEKLKGGWILVRRGGKSERDERNWFLFKARDEEADDKTDILEADRSVDSGRSMEEIAAQKSRTWDSSHNGNGSERKVRAPQKSAKSAARKTPVSGSAAT